MVVIMRQHENYNELSLNMFYPHWFLCEETLYLLLFYKYKYSILQATQILKTSLGINRLFFFNLLSLFQLTYSLHLKQTYIKLTK